MTDDLFGDMPPPEPAKQRQPRQKPGDAPLAAKRIYGIDALPPPQFLQEPDAGRKCERKARNGGKVCRVGGGDACFSDNGGQTWFCRKHRTRGFLPSDR